MAPESLLKEILIQYLPDLPIRQADDRVKVLFSPRANRWRIRDYEYLDAIVASQVEER